MVSGQSAVIPERTHNAYQTTSATVYNKLATPWGDFGKALTLSAPRSSIAGVLPRLHVVPIGGLPSHPSILDRADICARRSQELAAKIQDLANRLESEWSLAA